MNTDFPEWRQGMSLPVTPPAPYHKLYCVGTGCPSRNNCQLHANKDGYECSAWSRRYAGDSACMQFKAIRPVSTFQASERHAS